MQVDILLDFAFALSLDQNLVGVQSLFEVPKMKRTITKPLKGELILFARVSLKIK